MGNLFAAPPTPTQMLKDSQKLLRKGIRELDREASRMQLAEVKLIAEIKRLAQQGSTGVKPMAKELIRARNGTQKFIEMSSQLRAVSMRIRTMQSTATMANAMRSATRAMATLNRQMNNAQLQQIMMMFEREGEVMELKQDIMDDTIDDVMSSPLDDEQEEELINQIMDEIGIETMRNLNSPLGPMDGNKIPGSVSNKSRV